MESLSVYLLSLLLSSPAAAASPAVAPAAATSEAPAAAPGKQVSASAVLASVQAFYDGTTEMQADFKQTYVHPVYGTRTVTTGEMKLRKPGMMVWDYAGEGDPDFYVDGEKLWVVEHDTRQVVSQKVSGNSSLDGAVKFLFGGQKLVKEFKVRLATAELTTRYGSAGHTVVELKPKEKSPHYKTILLVVDDQSGRVDSFVVRNQDNSINHFELAKIALNPGFRADLFKYKVPKGYVETRE
ncbi:MAG: outer membrane lipoprotein carrier protein LolA [Nannocystis sp.]|nr:outer membrane lipoprotein carrier protein LolA [Nannocystis sp.]